MGQYYYIVNLDKQEYLYPHKLGSGLKFGEILSTKVPQVLVFLLHQSTDNGYVEGYKNAGRWAGDRITVVGDYDDSNLYQKVAETFKDISLEVREEWERYWSEPLGKRWDIRDDL
jgi:hypothetical protein